MLMVLTALLLSYGGGLSISGDKALPVTTAADSSHPSLVYAASDGSTELAKVPTLPRDFTLPTPLFAPEGNPINASQLAPITQMFLTALRTYGAYLVDNAGGFTFYAEDIHTAVLHLTDAQVNTLIGQSPGTSLPASKTKWQIVIEKLNQELEWNTSPLRMTHTDD